MAVLHKTKMCRFHGMGACSKGEACTFAHHRSELSKQPNLQKTQQCLAFQRNGVCRDGAQCKYAHGEHELRRGGVASAKRGSSQQGPPPPAAAALQDACLPLPLPSDLSAIPLHVPLPPGMGDLDVSQAFLGFGDMGDLSADADTFFQNLSAWSSMETDALMYFDPDAAQKAYPSMAESDVPTTTAGSSQSDGDSAEDASNEGSAKVKMTDALLRNTKMCKFFAKGLCTKGDQCGFAHKDDSLRVKPDLYRTRLCSSFSRNGTCKAGDACLYAHGPEQLRPGSDTYDVLQQQEEAKYGSETNDESGSKMLEPFYLTFDAGRVCFA